MTMIYGDAAEAVRERRLRRVADRQGLRLVKSKCRTPERYVYGTYGVIDPVANWWICCAGGEGYGLSLDEIEEALTD